MTTKKRTIKKVSQAELKRQIAALKLVSREQVDTIASLQQATPDVEQLEPILLRDRCTSVLGAESGKPGYYLDGDEETAKAAITKVDQGEGEILYQVSLLGNSKKTAYFGELEDAGEQGERWITPTKRAIDTPVSIRKIFESEEQDIPQQETREMKSTGPAKDALDQASVIIPAAKVYSADKMEMMRFMEEELQVMVHETTNDQDVPIPCIQNDGLSQYFVRGVEQTVKRKFVEILGRCKTTRFGLEKYLDAVGADAYRYPPQTALTYPFSVMQDPSGERGRIWLKQLISEEG